MNIIVKFLLILSFIYLLLFFRYKYTEVQKNPTLYIEDKNVFVRKDNLLTLYERPKTFDYNFKSFKESKLHRYFEDITLMCNLPVELQMNLFVFHPDETKHLYTSILDINLFTRVQYSHIDIHKLEEDEYLNKYMLCKNAKFSCK